MLSLILFAIGGVGAALLLGSSGAPSLRVSGDCCSSCRQGGPCGSPSTGKAGPQTLFDGQLVQGKLYRLRLSIDPRYQDLVREQAKTRAKSITPEAFLSGVVKELALRTGFGPTLLVTHDPTDPRIWNLLTRWSLHSSRCHPLPNVTPLSIVPVNEPPQQSKADSGLDNGLTRDELWVVSHALATDDNTKHLGGLASTLDPHFPVAAGLLRAKAHLAALRSYKNPLAVSGKSLSSLVTALQKVSTFLGTGVSGAWEKYRDLTVSPRDEAALGEIVKKLARDFLTRKGRPLPASPSPTALQLAYATRRPSLSGVKDTSAINERLTDLHHHGKAGHPDARKAQAKLDDANRLLERLQWVEWYKRSSGLAPEGPSPGSLTGGGAKAWSMLSDEGRVRGGGKRRG